MPENPEHAVTGLACSGFIRKIAECQGKLQSHAGIWKSGTVLLLE